MKKHNDKKTNRTRTMLSLRRETLADIGGGARLDVPFPDHPTPPSAYCSVECGPWQ